MRMVCPWRCNSSNILIIVKAVSLSRFAVGSSAKIIFGSCAIALAMETLCCSPPESWLGRLLILSPKPTRVKCSMAFSVAIFLSISCIRRGMRTFSRAVSSGTRA